MGSRLKEDEKNERIIRGFLKQPPNRKCINCNILGPQYVCTTFSTFICTTCSGIHREFTHRVKSVSMAKFTPQEIASLQTGGNERAREIYFKEWDPQRHSAPDCSNVERLRDFIKHVYVDRRYTGGSIDKPPQVQLGDKEESNENRRSEGYQSGSRSPRHNGMYERQYSGGASSASDVRGSPGYDQDNQRHSDYGRSPARSGVVNDWRREDRFANGRRSEIPRGSDGESKAEIRSPDHQKDSNISSLPVVRPVREILGDNVTPLRISGPPKSSSSRVADGPAITQRSTSSSSLASSNSNPVELKRETSLIDFDAEPGPPSTPATQVQLSTACQSVAQTSAPSDDNWACFDNISENNTTRVSPNSNSLDSLVTQLSVPASAPISGAAGSRAAPTSSNNLFPSSTSGNIFFAPADDASTMAYSEVTPAASQVNNLSSIASGSAPSASGLSPALPVNGGTVQGFSMQPHQQPLPHGGSSQPSAQQLPPTAPSSLSRQGLTGNPIAQASQPHANPVAQTVEVKSSGRNELPADLFTALYSSVPYQAPGWQTGFIPGMGYPMQFNPAMIRPTMPLTSNSSNPFDVKFEASVQAAAFPSVSSAYAALPNTVASRGFAHASNLGPGMPSWMPPQLSSYPSAMPHPAQPFGSAMSGTHMGQQLPTNMTSSRPQGFGGFGGEGAAVGSFNPAAATLRPSLGRNPFG